MTQEEKVRAYDEAIKKAKKELAACGSQDCDAARQIIRFFPELQESEDEKVKRILHSISNKISFHLHDIFTEEEFQCFDAWSNAWLKKQAPKNKTALDEAIEEEVNAWLEFKKLDYKPQGKTALEAVKEISPAESLGISPEKYEEIVNECIYGKTILDDKKKLASSENIGKNDTLLDLLQKMPSCITVDDIDYHFVLKKTIAYMAFYEGEGEEGRDKIIFWMAGDPIVLLTAMLEKLKEEGLLE